jgi:hypothetical protein
MNRVLVLGVLALVMPVLATQSISAQANPRLGTWKLNVTKSKYEGTAPAKSETRTYSAAADGATTLMATATLADGSTQTTNYTAKYDGKPYPLKPSADTFCPPRRTNPDQNQRLRRKSDGTRLAKSGANIRSESRWRLRQPAPTA